MNNPIHPGAEKNQDDYDFLGVPYVFLWFCLFLLCFPMVFHPGDPVNTGICLQDLPSSYPAASIGCHG